MDDKLLRHRVAIGRCAWVTAWLGLVAGQLHALSRHRTEDGRSDLEMSWTAAWSEPVGDALGPLLTWGDPDLVYVTYGKLWAPVALAVLLAAVVARADRGPGGAERWVWRVAIAGYALAVVGVTLSYWTQWTGSYNALFDVAFVVTMPGVLLTLVGSTVLGIVLLAKGFRPRVPAVLLAAALPLALVITSVTSLGSVLLPVAFAYGVMGRRWTARRRQITGATDRTSAVTTVGREASGV